MNIVITGASSGIGYQTALAFSATIQNRIICMSRNVRKLKMLHDEVYKKNPAAKLMILELDLETLDEKKIKDVLADYGMKHIDILINNAGALINKPFGKLTDADWQHLYGVNVFGVAKLIKLLLPYLQHKEIRSHIVNISSMGGVQGSSKFSGLSAYSSSKGALAVLTECLAEEFKPLNISVNCLAIGAVQTEMLQKAFPDYRAPLEAAQMAAFIVDFATNGHRYFNGKILPVSLSTP
ncbi:MAG: SDR family oxidoreductase [Bacteroidia bacterium]|nr:SDR family oxidoreductase [Bacteroidia bacterium]